MEVGGMLPSHSQEEISPIKEGDYVGEDGLIRCGVCGKRKQFKIEISGFRKIVPCICKCRSDEIEKEKQKDEYEQRMHAINRLKDTSMMASKFRDANFSGYKVREENQEAYKLALNYVKKFRKEPGTVVIRSGRNRKELHCRLYCKRPDGAKHHSDYDIIREDPPGHRNRR